MVDGTQIPFRNSANILGLTLTTHGLSNHIKQKKARANHQLVKMKRFRKLDPKLKVRLYKSMIRPVMEYPPAPICVASRTNIKRLQQTQNKTLRSLWPGNAIEDRVTNVQLHNYFDIEPLNIRLYNLALNT